jgi:hypothetical protein
LPTHPFTQGKQEKLENRFLNSSTLLLSSPICLGKKPFAPSRSARAKAAGKKPFGAVDGNHTKATLTQAQMSLNFTPTAAVTFFFYLF